MPIYLPLSIVFVTFVGVGDVFAQAGPLVSVPISTEPSPGNGRISGIVLDEAGGIVSGVSVLASGSTVVLARSDRQGRFVLRLPVGDYLLRAARDGYVSTHREPVRVDANGRIEREIRMARVAPDGPQPVAPARPPVPLVEDQPAPVPDTAPAGPDGLDRHGHSEIAWRLRHLRRTVLRDVAPNDLFDDESVGSLEEAAGAPWDDRAAGGWARTAGSILAATDFTGHINLLTTSSLTAAARPTPAGWTHGIADVFVGAPVGRSGDWSIRGAMAAGNAASWTLLGEYQSRPNQSHELRLAVSYSTFGYGPVGDLPGPSAVAESRNMGGMLVADRWHVRPSLVVDYGIRFDRDDYLSEPNLVSPHAGVRIRVAPRTFVGGSVSERSVAPGADQFLPPSESGPWLPPARTFYPLTPDSPPRPERIQRHAVGVDREFGSDGTTALSAEWFSERTVDQFATLFGLDRASEVGHYYVATIGDVAVTGWRVRLEGQVNPNVHGSVEYTGSQARWSGTRTAGAMALRQLVPDVARRGREAVADLKTAVDVSVPKTATHVVLAYRINRATPTNERAALLAIGGGGFDFEVRQRLPYQPLNAGLLNVLFTMSTLIHSEYSGSIYDELLTVQAPRRLTAGLQLGF